MRKFDIDVTWTVKATIEVEAETVDEALENVLDTPLPEGEFVCLDYAIDCETNKERVFS